MSRKVGTFNLYMLVLFRFELYTIYFLQCTYSLARHGRKSYWYGNGAAHWKIGRWVAEGGGAFGGDLPLCYVPTLPSWKFVPWHGFPWTAETLWSHLEASQVELAAPELPSSSQPTTMSSLDSSGLPTRAG